MSRKDYVMLAEIFARRCNVCGRRFTKLSGGTRGCQAHGIQFGEAPPREEMLQELVSALKSNNPRFDPDKFLAACGEV